MFPLAIICSRLCDIGWISIRVEESKLVLTVMIVHLKVMTLIHLEMYGHDQIIHRLIYREIVLINKSHLFVL